MHRLLPVLLFFLAWSSEAQYRLTLRITSLPPYHQASDPVFIAGSFNGWNPGQKEAQLQRGSDGTYALSLTAPAGTYEYKITRGSWETVETGANGAPIANRQLQVLSDTVIHISVLHWADHFGRQLKRSTATAGVRILADSFYIPQLDRWRRIWIYLPEDYHTARRRYPVLYLQDGQNVFEDSTSFSGEWGVDEALDTLGPKAGAAIVVAIDHGGPRRINEYLPFDSERFGKGEGDLYADFLVRTLQPHINRLFRTKRRGKHQFIAGSSMGGLISFYALLKYPEKFGGAGVFSPAFWTAPAIREEAGKRARRVRGRIYFYAGGAEGESMVPDLLSVFSIMDERSRAQITTVIRAEGRHQEAAWRKEFPLFYRWMLK